jgi:hypothetical protein
MGASWLLQNVFAQFTVAPPRYEEWSEASPMTIVTVSESTATADDYERLQEAMTQPGVPKPLVHIACPIDGGWRAINVWASQDDVDAMVKAFSQYMQSLGTDGWAPRRTVNPVYRLVINTSATD